MPEAPWTDDTVMPWGKHRGRKLSEVPPSYLLFLFEQPWIKEWVGLHAYLKKNEDLLIAEREESGGRDGDDKGFESYQDYRDYRGF
jgi:hypothetical protein